MKHFNYNPFTYRPRYGTEYFTISGSPFSSPVKSNITYGTKMKGYDNSVPANEMGNFKKRSHANLALKIARDAILSNVKE